MGTIEKLMVFGLLRPRVGSAISLGNEFEEGFDLFEVIVDALVLLGKRLLLSSIFVWRWRAEANKHAGFDGAELYT